VIRGLSPLRTRRQRLASLLLPALVLRALIPVGFMPLAGSGGVHLGFCPGAGPVPAARSELARHAPHHAHHDGGAPGAPGTSHQAACVFSAGASTVFAETPSATLTAALAQAPAERAASLTVLPSILRAQSSRGPPIPS
jgi:hypothetical protein